MGSLDQPASQLAETTLTALRRLWREVAPSDDLRFEAQTLLTRFPLRAADALQLAAAVTWVVGRPARRPFICGDAQLLEAAGQLGFEAIEA